MVNSPRMDTDAPAYPCDERVMRTRNALRIPGPQRNAGDITDGARGDTRMARTQTPAFVATIANRK